MIETEFQLTKTRPMIEIAGKITYLNDTMWFHSLVSTNNNVRLMKRTDDVHIQSVDFCSIEDTFSYPFSQLEHKIQS